MTTPSYFHGNFTLNVRKANYTREILNSFTEIPQQKARDSSKTAVRQQLRYSETGLLVKVYHLDYSYNTCLLLTRVTPLSVCPYLFLPFNDICSSSLTRELARLRQVRKFITRRLHGSQAEKNTQFVQPL